MYAASWSFPSKVVGDRRYLEDGTALQLISLCCCKNKEAHTTWFPYFNYNEQLSNIFRRRSNKRMTASLCMTTAKNKCKEIITILTQESDLSSDTEQAEHRTHCPSTDSVFEPAHSLSLNIRRTAYVYCSDWLIMSSTGKKIRRHF